MTYRFDAIVVGAGFAGVAAARELGNAGFRTAVLEARDRVGGRTWTADDAFGGMPLEMGGMSVHWAQPHVWSEVTRYRLGITARQACDTIAVVSGSELQRFSATDARFRKEHLWTRFFGDLAEAFERPYDPLFRYEAVRELDRRSLQDRLDEVGFSDDDEHWLSGLLYSYGGGALEERSLTSILRWFALGGAKPATLFDSTSRFRIDGGTVALIERMLESSRAELRLDLPVTAISDDGSQVEVLTPDGTYTAAVAVVATPVGLWPSIDFTPGLSPARIAAAEEGLCAPQNVKTWARLRGQKDRVEAYFPAGSPIGFLRSEEELPDGQTVFCASCNPSFDPQDHDLIAKTIVEVFQGGEVTDIVAHAWGHDEWARGGHPYYRPEQLTKYLKALQQPAGRVTFATSDIASGWSGFIDGAIESGIAAGQVARSVAAESRSAIGAIRSGDASDAS